MLFGVKFATPLQMSQRNSVPFVFSSLFRRSQTVPSESRMSRSDRLVAGNRFPFFPRRGFSIVPQPLFWAQGVVLGSSQKEAERADIFFLSSNDSASSLCCCFARPRLDNYRDFLVYLFNFTFIDDSELYNMATVATIPMPMSPVGRGHTPMVSTFDPSFSPGSLHLAPFNNNGSPENSPTSSFLSPAPSSLSSHAVPMGSRYERVPYNGPGSARYVRQPTRAQLVSWPFSIVLRRALTRLIVVSRKRTTASSALRTDLTTTEILKRNS